MRNLLPERLYTKCGQETFHKNTFKKSKNEHISGGFVKFVFIAYQDHLILVHKKLFQKTKRSLKLVFLPHFLHAF